MDSNLRHTRVARRRSARRESTLIEVLIANMVCAVCLAGLVSFLAFALSLTIQTDQLSVAYNLGRHVVEETKQTGFNSTPEGTSTLYYDNQGGSENTTRTANHVYSVTTLVSSSATVNGSSPVQPAPGALRMVTITVNLLNTGQTVYQTSTYFTRAGI